MELLDEVKRKLGVSWAEDDAYIATLIEKAKDYINGICGCTFDYHEVSKHRTLMIDRVFYDWNNALHDFERNYQSEITALIVFADLRR